MSGFDIVAAGIRREEQDLSARAPIFTPDNTGSRNPGVLNYQRQIRQLNEINQVPNETEVGEAMAHRYPMLNRFLIAKTEARSLVESLSDQVGAVNACVAMLMENVDKLKRENKMARQLVREYTSFCQNNETAIQLEATLMTTEDVMRHAHQATTGEKEVYLTHPRSTGSGGPSGSSSSSGLRR